MTRTAVMEREAATTVIESPQSPVRPTSPPHFRPDADGPGILPLADPNWKRVDAYRQEAWDRGISQDELVNMVTGYCPAQVGEQIESLQRWLTTHPA